MEKLQEPDKENDDDRKQENQSSGEPIELRTHLKRLMVIFVLTGLAYALLKTLINPSRAEFKEVVKFFFGLFGQSLDVNLVRITLNNLRLLVGIKYFLMCIALLTPAVFVRFVVYGTTPFPVGKWFIWPLLFWGIIVFSSADFLIIAFGWFCILNSG
ncbi:MAG: hypothetical protein LBT24_06860 [Tannerella sp.]|jgi:hypothetical protein|nr:hypothetical protein [Tannerella sp.]